MITKRKEKGQENLFQEVFFYLFMFNFFLCVSFNSQSNGRRTDTAKFMTHRKIIITAIIKMMTLIIFFVSLIKCVKGHTVLQLAKKKI